MATIEDLQKEIEVLKARLTKQGNVIQKTGQQIMELRLHHQRADIQDLDQRNKMLKSQTGTGGGAGDDYMTNDDVVELVQELQGQLDLLDERNVRRIVNSRSSAGAPITPLPNSAGEYPESFPKTSAEFEKSSDSEIEALCQFYELLPPDESEIKEMLQQMNISPAQAAQTGLSSAQETKMSPTEQYNVLSQFLGLPPRQE